MTDHQAGKRAFPLRRKPYRHVAMTRRAAFFIAGDEERVLGGRP
jgi:hypothetical protein